eukprot:31266-Pelagococcus_subviridis.AAC.6
MSPHAGYSSTTMCRRVHTHPRFCAFISAGIACERPQIPCAWLHAHSWSMEAIVRIVVFLFGPTSSNRTGNVSVKARPSSMSDRECHSGTSRSVSTACCFAERAVSDSIARRRVRDRGRTFDVAHGPDEALARADDDAFIVTGDEGVVGDAPRDEDAADARGARAREETRIVAVCAVASAGTAMVAGARVGRTRAGGVWTRSRARRGGTFGRSNRRSKESHIRAICQLSFSRLIFCARDSRARMLIRAYARGVVRTRRSVTC